jgi:hypothetical protein
MNHFYFLTSFCNYQENKSDIIFSINNNLKNILFKKIFLLIDVGLPFENMYNKFVTNKNVDEYKEYIDKIFLNFLGNKKICIYIIKKRPTYENIFNFCNNFSNIKWIVSNSDIHFPLWNINKLKLLLNKDYSKYSFVLTRYNILDDLNEPWKSGKINGVTKPWLNGIIIENENIKYKSQNVDGSSIDSWIFQSPFNILELNLDFEIGQPECDGRMNFQLQKVREVLNPCLEIVSIHKHINWDPKVYEIVKYNNTKYTRKLYNNLYEKNGLKLSTIKFCNIP